MCSNRVTEHAVERPQTGVEVEDPQALVGLYVCMIEINDMWSLNWQKNNKIIKNKTKQKADDLFKFGLCSIIWEICFGLRVPQ